MPITFFDRLFQSLFLGLMSSGFFLGNIPTQALTVREIQAFKTEYIKGCLDGIVKAGLDRKVGQKYCDCTLENLLKLPDEKLVAFAAMTEEELLQNGDIQEAISGCIPSDPNVKLQN